MLNKEKYAKEILDIVCKTGDFPAVVKNRPAECNNTKCKDCNFGGGDYGCIKKFLEWANSEYKEREIDWRKVPVDTPVYVRSSFSWNKRHFYKFDSDNELYYCYSDGKTSWSDEGNVEVRPWEQCKLAEGVDCSEWYKD